MCSVEWLSWKISRNSQKHTCDGDPFSKLVILQASEYLFYLPAPQASFFHFEYSEFYRKRMHPGSDINCKLIVFTDFFFLISFLNEMVFRLSFYLLLERNRPIFFWVF